MHWPLIFQAHSGLESLLRFGLTLYWNQTPRSGSSRVGQFFWLLGWSQIRQASDAASKGDWITGPLAPPIHTRQWFLP